MNSSNRWAVVGVFSSSMLTLRYLMLCGKEVISGFKIILGNMFLKRASGILKENPLAIGSVVSTTMKRSYL